ncbi:MAG: 50S ribosomal protein L5 [Calditrichaeota bacterium]|nr:50S ribosomal protein L5 [Calditrichota bacterium]MCB9366224.1 50S ribosomal protein L5 [Calditrichota bacterium]MCB9391707.1 50S ribosomal protein L5 [Calditrichota bacterium]
MADKAKSKPQAAQGKPGKGGAPAKPGKGGGLNVAGERPKLPNGYEPRLHKHYKDNVVAGLKKTFSYENPMEVPRLMKITINVGCGDATQNPRVVESIVKEMALITGQKPTVAKARKSVSNFKLREGMPVGVFVTMRRTIMWEFLDRFISLATPRIRDFRGLPDRGFDGRGNFSLGLREQILFPEIDLDQVEKIRGMDITFVTTAKSDKEAYELLKQLGLPFRKREDKKVAAAA